jgi:hypothetical protein
LINDDKQLFSIFLSRINIAYQGFTYDEFDILKSWSGWAHTLDNCSANSTKKKIKLTHEFQMPSKQDQSIEYSANREELSHIDPEEHADNSGHNIMSRCTPHGLNYDQMSLLGKMIKRVIDQGRVEHFRKLGFQAFQTKYCDAELSPECFMIIARHL